MEGLINVKPLRFYIWIAEMGQPDRAPSGLFYPDGLEMSARYEASEWRYGLVLAVGPGSISRRGKLIPLLEPRPGEIVVYSRRMGTKTEMQYHHPKYGDLYVRVLDPNQVDLVIEEGFEPWWNPGECQKGPGMIFNS